MHTNFTAAAYYGELVSINMHGRFSLSGSAAAPHRAAAARRGAAGRALGRRL